MLCVSVWATVKSEVVSCDFRFRCMDQRYERWESDEVSKPLPAKDIDGGSKMIAYLESVAEAGVRLIGSSIQE